MSDFNDRVIAEFRSNGGQVQGFGSALVLVHSIGARSGEQRINPVAAMQEGGSWLIVASAAGAKSNPAWYHNLIANPDVTIETPQGSVDVHAMELTDDGEWQAAFARFVARSPAFGEYQQKAAPRRIPVFRLDPRG